MSNNKVRPPWIKNAATQNVYKRAKLAAIIRRKAQAERQAELAALKLDTAR